MVEAQFSFAQVPQAFQKLEEGHARGKTVVLVAEEEEEEDKGQDPERNGKVVEPERRSQQHSVEHN